MTALPDDEFTKMTALHKVINEIFRIMVHKFR